MRFFKSKEAPLMSPEEPIKKEAHEGRETRLYEEVGEFLGRLAPEKYKQRATALLTTLSMFLPAASAFANETQKQNLQEGVAAEDVLLPSQSFKNQPILSHTQEVVTNKLQAHSKVISEKSGQSSVSSNEGDLLLNRSGSPVGHGFESSALLRGFSPREVAQIIDRTYGDALRQSLTADTFFSQLEGFGGKLDFSRKMLVLRALGTDLGSTYDYDMLARNEHVAISDDAFFQALKGILDGEELKTGICGNIHTFLARAGQKMGLETWLESGFYNGGEHIFMGTVGEINGKKQIVFLNYDTVIPTGTLNYEEALGVWERHTERVSTFGSYVANTDSTLFPVESRAGKVIQKTMGYEATDERLRKKMKGEKEPANVKSLDIQLSPEMTEMQIQPDTIGLVFLNYKDIGRDPNQPLESLQALRIPLVHPSQTPLSFEEDITVLHMNLKNMYGGTVPRDVLALRFAADYIDTLNLTKGEYGKFLLRYGLTVQGAATIALDEMMNSDVRLEAGGGARLVYVNPDETGTFYVGADVLGRLQVTDAQDQNIVFKKVSETFTLGGRVQVQKAQFFDFEASLSQKDYGDVFTIGGGLDMNKIMKLRASYEKTVSGYERFKPSSDEITAGLDFTLPIGEIDILGFTKTEKYAGDNPQNSYGVDLKMRIVF